MAPDKQVTHADMVAEQIIAAEYGESVYTWRNRRRRGEGPPHYRLPGKKSPTYYSRAEVAEYYKQFRVVPVITARRMEELHQAQAPAPNQPKRNRARKALQTKAVRTAP